MPRGNKDDRRRKRRAKKRQQQLRLNASLSAREIDFNAGGLSEEIEYIRGVALGGETTVVKFGPLILVADRGHAWVLDPTEHRAAPLLVDRQPRQLSYWSQQGALVIHWGPHDYWVTDETPPRLLLGEDGDEWVFDTDILKLVVQFIPLAEMDARAYGNLDVEDN